MKFKAKLIEAKKSQEYIKSIVAGLVGICDKDVEQDVTEALQSTDSYKRDVDAILRALEEAVVAF